MSREAGRALNDVKLGEAATVETRRRLDSIDDGLGRIIRRSIEARIALASVGGGGRGGGGGIIQTSGGGGLGREDARFQPGDLVRGILPGGRRQGPAALGLLAALGISAAPGLIAGAGGLGLFGAAAIGSGAGAFAAGGAAGLGDIIKGMTDLKEYQRLSGQQRATTDLFRSTQGGIGRQLSGIAQDTVLPGIRGGLTSALTPQTIHALTSAMQAFGQATGSAARDWGRFFGSREFSSQFGMLMQRNSGYLGDFSKNLQRSFDIALRFSNNTSGVVDWLDKVTTGAIKSAQAWSQSARGAQQMRQFSDLAIRGLRDFGHLLYATGDAVKQLLDILGGLSVMNLLARALEGLATILRQNKDVLKSFFAGAQQSLNDVFTVVGQISRLLRPLLRLLNAVATEIGGWRVVIDAAGVAIIVKIVGGWLAAKVAASAAATEMEAALAPLLVELQAINAELVGMGASAVAGTTEADAALVTLGTTANAVTLGPLAKMLGALRFLGGAAAVTFAAITAYNLVQPSQKGNDLPGAPATGTTPNGETIYTVKGKQYTFARSRDQYDTPGAISVGVGRGPAIVLIPYNQKAAGSGTADSTLSPGSHDDPRMVTFEPNFTANQRLAIAHAQSALATATTAKQQKAAQAQLVRAYQNVLASVQKQHPGTAEGRAQKAEEIAALQQTIAAYGPPPPFETNVPKPKHPRKGVFDPLTVDQHAAISQAQQAFAQAQTSGDVAAQVAAAQALQQTYRTILTAVKAEHETGRNRVKQLAEEATLAKDIASTHQRIVRLIKEQNAATVLSDLGQGPYLTSPNAQTALSFGYKPTGHDYLIDIRRQAAASAQENRDLATLRQHGASAGLISSLRGQGQQGADIAHALANASLKDLHAYEQVFATRQRQARVANMTVHAQSVTINAKGISHRNTGGAPDQRSGDSFLHQRKQKFIATRRNY